MYMLSTYLFSACILFVLATVLFIVAQIKNNNSIIDIGYGWGFIITAFLLACNELILHPLTPQATLLFFLICIWGIRLSYRIYKKNAGKEEDFRYRAWREEWQRKSMPYFYVRSYFQIFLLQGFVISIVLLPFTLTVDQSFAAHSQLMLLGSVLWIIGFMFEAIGDSQLDAFIKNKNPNKGTIMTSGLWKYTRHPNYFGESLMWWAIALISYSASSSLFVFLSPILITYLLLFVSGIPMLEKKRKGNPDWEVYKKKTSAFIPLPPSKIVAK